MIDGVCRAAAHLRRACSLARVLMMGSTPDASLDVAVRRRGPPKTVSTVEFCIHSPSGLRMRTLPAQTTISESPKHPDDGPGVRAGRVSCLKLSLITLRIDP